MRGFANPAAQAGLVATCGQAATQDKTGGTDDAASPGGHSSREPNMPTDMRRLLRRATQRYHDRLDALSVLTPLVLPGVTLAQYQAATVALLRTYVQVDACLLQPPLVDCAQVFKTVAPYRARHVATQRDLHAMGIDPAPTVLQASTALDLPPDLPTYLGMRYVIEGSKFGNRVIWRHLQAAFGTAANDICTAWLPDMEAHDDWTSVMAALSALETRHDVAAALRGARQTFRCFVANLCMSSAGPSRLAAHHKPTPQGVTSVLTHDALCDWRGALT